MEVRCGDPLVTQHEGGHGGLAVPVLIAHQPPLTDDGVLAVVEAGAGGRAVGRARAVQTGGGGDAGELGEIQGVSSVSAKVKLKNRHIT